MGKWWVVGGKEMESGGVEEEFRHSLNGEDAAVSGEVFHGRGSVSDACGESFG